MKKLLLSFFLVSLMALPGFSQSLELSNANGTLAPNAYLIQVGSPDSSMLFTHITVKNISSSAVAVRTKKVELSRADSVSITMCWAGNCYPDTTYVSPLKELIEPGQSNSEFLGDYTAATASYFFNPGESVVRWVFFNAENVADSACVTVKYMTYMLGQDEQDAAGELSAIYPNPASSAAACRYAFPAGAQGAVIIRDLLGATVYSQDLASGNGMVKINTGLLSNGLYFCSLLVDGKVIKTQKLVVRH